ncbi:site-specific integrase [Panacibacter ginsenosidivorans]|uniref:Site-specific integrase n=1 Tax=Panacibacter ginsenosidivorans TaxID=1813871 RepID=A0A5B8VCS9_9BACT|nr:site-specific integrase [Panacibacter ginsenosidivorans]QEC69264.1 site-specific integrase [Panacibacter ginsenosidivorans]
MHQPIKLIIKKGKVRKDGTSLIFLQYCYSSSKRVLISTQVAIPPFYWNKKADRISENLPAEYGGVLSLETSLREKVRRAEKLVDYAIKRSKICPATFLKTNFLGNDNFYLESVDYDKQKMDVFYQIEKYIKDKRDFVQEDTVDVIRNMKKHLYSFQEYRKLAITFESFDLKFYEDFVKYLTYEIPHLRRKNPAKGLRVNTIGKTIKQLKGFLKDRISKKIIPYIDLNGYKLMEEEVDGVYLSWSELSRVYHLDLSGTPFLEKYRDMFVLGCLTGFRFSDYSNIKFNELRDGMLHVTQKKTLSSVIVPLREDARRILIDKYQIQIPQVSNVKFNYYIKEVVRLTGITEPVKITHKKGNKIIEEVRPKYAWVSSHTARRSFCTNEYLAGTPIDLIMTISGHKTEKTFRRYIKADRMKKACMIKEIWDSQPAL